MSLRVWLPLNGDLRNQGLSNVTVTNNGATVNTSGKIGKCYYFDKSIPTYIKITNPLPQSSVTEISFAFWVKLPSNASGNNQILHIGTGSGWNNNRCTCFVRGGYSYLVFTCGDGTNSTQYTCASSSLTLNQWTHVCCIYKSNKMLIYLNGLLDKTYDVTVTPSFANTPNIGIGAAPNAGEPCTCYLNDVRIYDHALSAKEVEEIAKGLVLHYKLDDTYNESSVFLTSTVDNSTAYNGAINKYGYNETANMAKTIGTFQGKQCIKISTVTAGQTAQPYVYFSNLYTSNGTNAPAYKALSFDYFTTVPTTTWLNIYKLGNGNGTATWKTRSSSAGIRTGTYTNSSQSILITPNEWNHVEVVFHGTTDADAQWGYCINGPAHTSSSDYYFLYANIQLEENDHVTGYGESFHTTTVYDSSGYGNNGTITGNLTMSTPSPRCSVATEFNGSSYIKATNSITTTDSTISLWINSPLSAPSFILDARNSSGSGKWPIYSYTNGSIQTGGDAQFITTNTGLLVANTWIHLVLVQNGSSLLVYKNGVLFQTLSCTNSSIIQPSIGARYSNSGIYAGKLSDFRIYATVLTPEQVKELYNTSMSIDSSGNIHARELVEL